MSHLERIVPSCMESPSEALCISLSSFCRLRLRWASWWWAASEWQRVCCCLGRRACCCVRASLSVPQEMFVAENTTPAGRLCTKTCHSLLFLGFSHSSVAVSSPASVRDSFISTMLTKKPVSGKCRRWLYDDIKEAFFMRFLLEVIMQIPTTIQIYNQVILYAFKAPVPFIIRTTPSRYSWKTAIQPSWCSWTEIMSLHIKGTTFTQNTS